MTKAERAGEIVAGVVVVIIVAVFVTAAVISLKNCEADSKIQRIKCPSKMKCIEISTAKKTLRILFAKTRDQGTDGCGAPVSQINAYDCDWNIIASWSPDAMTQILPRKACEKTK